ncbi:molybdenum cofactor biosynthesis protein B [Gallaecimonas mangrovi]|uniref:molybdenum cofactor biosynthesis protein B n=1 Tax=Gallaecimonas mangrovi TaxID=2291597 RepID=UPI000E202FB7|nr:molybdenum cofactor biosynthesis protein B [Gallaecimonas mangrovi]
MTKASEPVQTAPLKIAVLTLSDRRTLAEDSSGDYLQSALQAAGHQLADRKLIASNLYQIRAVVSQWIADNQVQVVLISGGTGFHPRDCAPQALTPLFDRPVAGFGELFRHISFAEIGSASMQSNAFAGMANDTLIFCMPGSTNACRTAWQQLIGPQLDVGTKPCNFVTKVSKGA